MEKTYEELFLTSAQVEAKRKVNRQLKKMAEELSDEKTKATKNWAVYDFETDGKIVKYWALLHNDGTFKEGWRGREQFLAYLKTLNSKKTYYLYAHYGVKYDCSFLLGKMINECQINRNDQRITDIKWNNIRFLDSYLLFGEKLEKLPLTVEESRIKKKGKFALQSRGIRGMSKEEIRIYCQNDVRSLFRLLQEFFQANGSELIGKISISSVAMYCWKKQNPQHFQRLPNLVKPWYSPIYDFIQPYLMGGFVGMANQAIYQHNSKKYDLNSMYPDIMAKMPLPVGLPIKHLTWEKHCESCWNKEKKEYFRPHSIPNISKERIPFGFIRVEITNLQARGSARKIPFISVKDKEGNSYCPIKIGKLEGVYFSEFLKLILKHYTYSSIRYKEAYIFRSQTEFFTDWVEKYQKLKVEGKEKMEICSREEKPKWKQQYYFAKLMQNCLFGKFGQKKKIRPYLWQEGKSTNTSPTFRKDGKNYHLAHGEEKDSFGFNYIPIASAITAYGRIKLIETMFEIGVNNVLYWDTDCIVSKIKFPRAWIHFSAMGQWKLVQNYLSFVSLSAKAYHGKLRHGPPDCKFKGIGGKEILKQKIDPIKLLKKGGEVKTTESHWESWGVNIFKTTREICSGYQVKKAHFRKKRGGDYYWNPHREVSQVGWGTVKNNLAPFTDNVRCEAWDDRAADFIN